MTFSTSLVSRKMFLWIQGVVLHIILYDITLLCQSLSEQHKKVYYLWFMCVASQAEILGQFTSKVELSKTFLNDAENLGKCTGGSRISLKGGGGHRKTIHDCLHY